MNVLVIGAGNMGLTYSEGMSKSTLLNRKKLMIYDVSPTILASHKNKKNIEFMKI